MNTLKPPRGKQTSAESQNLVLENGGIFFEVPSNGVGSGAGGIKMGDGSTSYSDLPYFLKDNTEELNDIVNGVTVVAKATSATSARYATTATNAGTATYGTKAGTATYATNAGTAAYSSNGAKATSATSARYATTATNAGTATYAKTASTANHLNASTAYAKMYVVRDSNNANVGQMNHGTVGTTANTGISFIVVGNGKASSVAGNAQGFMRMYSATTAYAQLQTVNLTANRTVNIPNASGTMAYLNHLGRTNACTSASTAYGTYMARAIAASTKALTAGSTTMTNGTIYLQYV